MKAQLERCEALEQIKSSPIWWMRNATKTFDKHWMEKGLTSPLNSFPPDPYLDQMMEFLCADNAWLSEHGCPPDVAGKKRRSIEKSREVMATWGVIAWAVWLCQKNPQQQVLIQSQNQDKADEVIEYAKTLWKLQPDWLKEVVERGEDGEINGWCGKLSQRFQDFPKSRIAWEQGSEIVSIPQGGDQARSYHPTVYIMDESGFQPEGEDSLPNAELVCSTLVAMSTANSGWWQEFMVGSPWSSGIKHHEKPVEFGGTEKGWPVMSIHYSAIPAKAETGPAMRAAFHSKSRWDREMEGIYGAGGGDLALRELLDKLFPYIVITDPNWRPEAGWSYHGGMDYGNPSPTAFHAYAIDHRGCHYAILEHYQGGADWVVRKHAEQILSMRLPCDGNPTAYDKIDKVYADPMIFPKTQEQSTGEKSSIAELYSNAGFKKLTPGVRGGDWGLVEVIMALWMNTDSEGNPDPLFKIWCPDPLQYDRRRDGTYQGCPNLLWELRGLKRKELRAMQLETSNEPEKLVQKNNHAFDDCKYYFSSRPRAAEYTSEDRWMQRATAFNNVNPNLDEVTRINRQIVMRREFDVTEKKKQLVGSWR